MYNRQLVHSLKKPLQYGDYGNQYLVFQRLKFFKILSAGQAVRRTYNGQLARYPKYIHTLRMVFRAQDIISL
ncbi:MAG: hypothetical protein RI573_16270 [Balneolaceae bacterium]|nr:hypothetical protein [Balneolaceae bacterium]